MTRKEAIDILFGCIEAHSEEENEALDMAIEALKTDIVRCEECEWWQKQDDSLQGRCAKYGFYPTGKYFCAGGERGEGK